MLHILLGMEEKEKRRPGDDEGSRCGFGSGLSLVDLGSRMGYADDTEGRRVAVHAIGRSPHEHVAAGSLKRWQFH